LGWQKIVAQGGDFTAGNGTGGESIYGRLLAVIICEVKNLDFPIGGTKQSGLNNIL
jgi:hypothetical protein